MWETDSGGKGQYPGGLGCIRDVEFRSPVSAAILSDRRVHAPYGLHGGGDGATGLNLFIRKARDEGESDRVINLGPKNSVKAEVGDRIVILTPGGGAWGRERGNGEGALIEGVNRRLVTAAETVYVYPRAGGSLGERSAAQASN